MGNTQEQSGGLVNASLKSQTGLMNICSQGLAGEKAFCFKHLDFLDLAYLACPCELCWVKRNMHSITTMPRSYFEPMVTLKWDIILIYYKLMVDIWAGFHHICTLGSTTGKSFRTSKCCGSVTKAVRIDFPDSKPKYCKSGRKEWVKCDLILGQC